MQCQRGTQGCLAKCEQMHKKETARGGGKLGNWEAGVRNAVAVSQSPSSPAWRQASVDGPQDGPGLGVLEHELPQPVVVLGEDH